MKRNWRQARDRILAKLPDWRRGRTRMMVGAGVLLVLGGLIPVEDDSRDGDVTRMEMFNQAGPFEKSRTPLWRKLFMRAEDPPAAEAGPAANIADYLRGIPHGPLILDAAAEHEVDPLLVLSVMEAESGFRPDARSEVGAIGLMQLMPATGEWMGAKDLLDPVENVFAGTRYLKYLEGRFDGDLDRQLAAYNAGEGTVLRYGGVPPYRETRRYIARVLSNYDKRIAEFESYRTEAGESTR